MLLTQWSSLLNIMYRFVVDLFYTLVLWKLRINQYTFLQLCRNGTKPAQPTLIKEFFVRTVQRVHFTQWVMYVILTACSTNWQVSNSRISSFWGVSTSVLMHDEDILLKVGLNVGSCGVRWRLARTLLALLLRCWPPVVANITMAPTLVCVLFYQCASKLFSCEVVLVYIDR